MLLIRGFLWTLVGVMLLQGWLRADEYGSRTGMLGGVALSVAVWGERFGDGARSWFLWQPRRVLLPRALVVAALEETARRPRIDGLASRPLRTAVAAAETAEERMREAEARWVIRHGALLAALATEGREAWMRWEREEAAARAALAAAEGAVCWLPVMGGERCSGLATVATAAKQRVERATAAAVAWRGVLAMEEVGGARGWLRAVGVAPPPAAVQEIYDRLQELHDLEWPTDGRLVGLLGRLAAAAGIDGVWEQRAAASLLEGDVWATVIQHVRRRGARLREALAGSGAGELWMAAERALNSSLRLVPLAAESLVRDWFSEMAVYAWWIGSDAPVIVQRCAGQESGECVRIGPTEIATLSAQFNERALIVEDWVRRLFIGMWNALPAVGLVFVAELMVLACGGGAQWWRRRRWVDEAKERRVAVLRDR